VYPLSEGRSAHVGTSRTVIHPDQGRHREREHLLGHRSPAGRGRGRGRGRGAGWDRLGRGGRVLHRAEGAGLIQDGVWVRVVSLLVASKSGRLEGERDQASDQKLRLGGVNPGLPYLRDSVKPGRPDGHAGLPNPKRRTRQDPPHLSHRPQAKSVQQSSYLARRIPIPLFLVFWRALLRPGWFRSPPQRPKSGHVTLLDVVASTRCTPASPDQTDWFVHCPLPEIIFA